MQSPEAELEKLLESLVPDFNKEVKGATKEEIAELEKVSECDIPEFYQWFLSRMGRDMGELSFPTIDFTASKVIRCYREGLVKPDARYLLIGHESKPLFWNMFYDLDSQINGDAHLIRREPDEDKNDLKFETFREMLAWTMVLNYSVNAYPEFCDGLLIDVAGDVLLKLDPVMRDIGFNTPIKTGKYCGIYLGIEATLITSSTPEGNAGYHGFCLGGFSPEELRRILGEIESVTSFEIDIDDNDPRRLNYDD